ncbi:MAG TPA: hypothetical protein VH591_10550 [Ktedonobacterales bacterium]|jgi:hypothetical protein
MLHILSNVDSVQVSVVPDTKGAAGIPADPQFHSAPHHLSNVPDVPHLPIISAGGFDAHVLCAIGDTVGDTTYVTYLSLLGPGTAVAAIWASLMDQRQIVVTLEGVGNIQLWQRQPVMATLDYAISWRRRTRVLQLAHGIRLVHLVTEPDLLTMRDPESADAADQRRKRERGEGHEGRISSGARPARPVMSTEHRSHAGSSSQVGQDSQDSAAAIEQVSEQVARETHPLFVLLGKHDDSPITLARRHLLFLAQRIQWLAYYEPWAGFFWQRGLITGEVRPLPVWPIEGAKRSGQNGSAREQERWISSAFLCQPDSLALAAALPEVVQHHKLPQTMDVLNAGNLSAALSTSVASTSGKPGEHGEQGDEEGVVA